MSTIVVIIDIIIHAEYPSSPQVQKTVKMSNVDNATVILEWEQEVGVSYNVSVIPSPLESNSSGTMSQLVILYNTSYCVTVVATLCGNNMNRTAIDISVDRPGALDNVTLILITVTVYYIVLEAIVLTATSKQYMIEGLQSIAACDGL
jgi:hypothetical protein